MAASQGEIINIVYGWTFLLFIGAGDCEFLSNPVPEKRTSIMIPAVVMILRVWAMYSRSRPVLAILLVLFCLEILSTIIGVVIYSNPKHLSCMWILTERNA